MRPFLDFKSDADTVAPKAAVAAVMSDDPRNERQPPISDTRNNIGRQMPRRSDTALGKAIAEDTVIDEVLPEIKRRRADFTSLQLSPPKVPVRNWIVPACLRKDTMLAKSSS